jgi:chromosomal replication initiator protein
MLTCDIADAWIQFLEFVKERCSRSSYENWLAPIKVLKATPEEITLEVPNVFMQDYLLTQYKKELCAFLPVRLDGTPAILFVIAAPAKVAPQKEMPAPKAKNPSVSIIDGSPANPQQLVKLNDNYRFSSFIEGPANQFVKSAAMGVAARPGQSYNPLFIHGGVGLGKTHILHSIGHYVAENSKNLRVQCITTEAFINELVDNLRKKSIEELKRYYRSTVDVLLIDDIQFLQNRLNFEEEFCNMFEILFNCNKQIVITSDKPPAHLKLSERMIARMEWGLVAHIGVPDVETRVAILQSKAETKGLLIPSNVAFFIAEHIAQNVRQLEGAINRLSANAQLLNLEITEETVEKILKEMFHHLPHQRISVEQILKSVATIFQVRVNDLKGSARTKEIVLPRQVAMYLAKEMIKESLAMLGASFGKKTHSVILHAHKTIEEKRASDSVLQRQIDMVRSHIAASAA